jgi:hypothetical protein
MLTPLGAARLARQRTRGRDLRRGQAGLRIRRLAYFAAAGGAGAVGALIALQTLYVEPTTVFSIQYKADMLFMVLIGGIRTIEGPARWCCSACLRRCLIRRLVPGHRGRPGGRRYPDRPARAVGIRRRPVRLVPAPGRLPGASSARMTPNRPLG